MNFDIKISIRELEDSELFKSVPNNITLTNGAVIQLHHYLTRNNLTFGMMTLWHNYFLFISCNEKHLFPIIGKLSKEYKQKYKTRKHEEWQQFLSSLFQEQVCILSQNKTPDCSLDKLPNLASPKNPSVSAKIKTLDQSLKKLSG